MGYREGRIARSGLGVVQMDNGAQHFRLAQSLYKLHMAEERTGKVQVVWPQSGRTPQLACCLSMPSSWQPAGGYVTHSRDEPMAEEEILHCVHAATEELVCLRGASKFSMLSSKSASSLRTSKPWIKHLLTRHTQHRRSSRRHSR
mmetsp:Transcript_92391/g.160142  ORF Transcript_92391/g.160142 Transcript_92391/m.160142 type:complete len:145 (+) Transcript_92391:1373-1807(+)